jgi:Tol biopolymer transport system component
VVLHSAQGGLGSGEFSPDRQRLVYLADLDADYRNELFSVPLDGSATPTRLDGPRIPAGRVARFALTPDGSRAIYVADQLVEFKYELFSVPVDGSAVAVRLSQPLPRFGGVRPLRLVLAGGSVFYTASEDGARAELFRVPIDGSAAPVKLSAPLVNRGNVAFFDVTPDGSRAVYQADQEVDERFELYSAPASGSGPVRKLNGALGRGIVGGDNYFDAAISVGVLAISPDGERVVFRAGPDNQRELFSAPIDGSAPAIEISAPLAEEGTVLSGFRFTPDGKGVVYRAVQDFPSPTPGFALFHARLDVAASAERISGIGMAFDHYQTLPLFELEGGRVFYMLDQETEGVVELFFNLLSGPREDSGPRAKRSR